MNKAATRWKGIVIAIASTGIIGVAASFINAAYSKVERNNIAHIELQSSDAMMCYRISNCETSIEKLANNIVVKQDSQIILQKKIIELLTKVGK